MKLDMADKYPPAESFDDEDITLRMQVPNFLPRIEVADEGEEESYNDFDLHGQRDTVPCAPPYPAPFEFKRVNWGAVVLLLSVFAFWGTVAYFLFR